MKTVNLVKIKDEYFVFNEYNLKNDKYEYFKRGEGWKKTKKFEIIDAEIPESIDNLYDIYKTAEKYGKEVCMKYLITNNCESWKEHIYRISIKSKLNERSEEHTSELQSH